MDFPTQDIILHSRRDLVFTLEPIMVNIFFSVMGGELV